MKDIKDEIIKKQDELIKLLKRYGWDDFDVNKADKLESELASLKAELEKENIREQPHGEERYYTFEEGELPELEDDCAPD